MQWNRSLSFPSGPRLLTSQQRNSTPLSFPAIYCDAISILDNNGELTRTAIAVLSSTDIMGQLLAKYP